MGNTFTCTSRSQLAHIDRLLNTLLLKKNTKKKCHRALEKFGEYMKDEEFMLNLCREHERVFNGVTAVCWTAIARHREGWSDKSFGEALIELIGRSFNVLLDYCDNEPDLVLEDLLYAERDFFFDVLRSSSENASETALRGFRWATWLAVVNASPHALRPRTQVNAEKLGACLHRLEPYKYASLLVDPGWDRGDGNLREEAAQNATLVSLVEDSLVTAEGIPNHRIPRNPSEGFERESAAVAAACLLAGAGQDREKLQDFLGRGFLGYSARILSRSETTREQGLDLDFAWEIFEKVTNLFPHYKPQLKKMLKEGDNELAARAEEIQIRPRPAAFYIMDEDADTL